MEMAEDLEGEVADRPLRHRREDRVAHLAEGLGQHAGEAVGHDQGDRHRHDLGLGLAQRVDGVLVEDRHVDVGDLGQHQQHQRHDDARAQAPFALWPQMAAKDRQHGPGAVEADAGRAVVVGGDMDERPFRARKFRWRGGRGPSIVPGEAEVSPPVESDFMSFRRALLAFALCVGCTAVAHGPGSAAGRDRLRDHLRRASPAFASTSRRASTAHATTSRARPSRKAC